MDLKEVLDVLLPGDKQTGDIRTDLLAAANRVREIRENNTVWGGVILAALQDPRIMGEGRALSERAIERQTGIPRSTIGRWSLPPGSD